MATDPAFGSFAIQVIQFPGSPLMPFFRACYESFCASRIMRFAISMGHSSLAMGCLRVCLRWRTNARVSPRSRPAQNPL